MLSPQLPPLLFRDFDLLPQGWRGGSLELPISRYRHLRLQRAVGQAPRTSIALPAISAPSAASQAAPRADLPATPPCSLASGSAASLGTSQSSVCSL